MRSMASIKGHPLHPALIPFPFAFLTGAFLFDFAGWYLERPMLWIAGSYLNLAGVGFAFLAAIPGLVDYFFTVPPRSSGKRRATQHMILNVVAVILFLAAWKLRGSFEDPPVLLTLVTEFVAVTCLMIAGYMGGTLVSRNQIS